MSNGLYYAQYVPQIAGTYSVSIKLLDLPIKGSPFTLIVVPGEVAPTNCITSLGLGPLTVRAGITKFFTLSTYDLYNNKEVVSYNTT